MNRKCANGTLRCVFWCSKSNILSHHFVEQCPNQLFIQGALERNRSIQYPLPSQQHGVSPLPQSLGAVDVPRATFHACGALISILGNIDVKQCMVDTEWLFQDSRKASKAALILG